MTSPPAACRHCQTPLAPHQIAKGFCCEGCAYVHQLIQDGGHHTFYELRDKELAPVTNAVFEKRDYRWLEEWITERETLATSNTEASGELPLHGISCIGCVWLIEQLFYEIPGTRRIEINTQSGAVRLLWQPKAFDAPAFAEKIQAFGYELAPPAAESPSRESDQLATRLGLCAAFALNAMLFTLPRYLGMESDFSLARIFEMLVTLFATLSLLTGGSYFIQRAVGALRAGVLHIDLPIALGLIGAYSGSLFGFFAQQERYLYFDFIAIFTFLMLGGRWLQERAVERNRNRLLRAGARPRTCRTSTDQGQSFSVQSIDTLQAGQLLRLDPGEVCPVEARLESSAATLNLAWISGESEARHLTEGRSLPAGAISIGRTPITATALESWEQSLLNRLFAQTKTVFRHTALERILKWYLAAILLIATAGTAAWAFFAGDFLTAGQVGLSILVVSCPCALGVAWPLASELAVTALRRHGLFVRETDLFARIPKIRHIVFDKTGTLTLEMPALANPQCLQSLDPEALEALWALVDSNLHPVGRAMRTALKQHAKAPAQPLPEHLPIHENIGQGVSILWKNHSYFLQKPRRHPIPTQPPANPDHIRGSDSTEKTDSSEQTQDPEITDRTDNTVSAEFWRDDQCLAAMTFHETLRPGTAQTIRQLARTHSLHILSGDQPEKVRRMAKQLGIPTTNAHGAQSPQDKIRFIQQLDQQNTLFIGDGANDAGAFAAAYTRGTPVVDKGILENQADFYFPGHSLSGLQALFTITRQRQQALRRVFTFALIYNAAALAICLSAQMNPLLAAILMPLSSIASLALTAKSSLSPEKKVGPDAQ